ncbi:MAG TPA: S26 family signal peptidase [Actinomycetota bacterium]
MLAAAAWAAWRPFRVAVEGTSMAPELEPGDLLVATRTGLLRPGDLVVVEHPERPGFELVKRLTALPGEYVGALALGPDQYWVTGDRRGSSADSTWFGPVGARHIRGVVRLRYWPPRRLAWLRT